jgi:hypothetical protein
MTPSAITKKGVLPLQPQITLTNHTFIICTNRLVLTLAGALFYATVSFVVFLFFFVVSKGTLS